MHGGWVGGVCTVPVHVPGTRGPRLHAAARGAQAARPRGTQQAVARRLGGPGRQGGVGALVTAARACLSLLLPKRWQLQRLGEQHVAELAGIHLNRGPGIEGTSNALGHGLIANAIDARRDLPGPGLTGQPDLQRVFRLEMRQLIDSKRQHRKA